MEKPFMKYLLLVMASILLMGSYGCSIRYLIEGKVFNVDTGQPVEGAVVSVLWEKHGSALAGLGGSVYPIEQYDLITKSDGTFRIPKYATAVNFAPAACLFYLFCRLTYVIPPYMDYNLAVYKKGYVCWESEDIFPGYEKREDFRLENGLVIELEPFRDTYSKDRHAIFVDSVIEGNSGQGNIKGLLYKTAEEESALYQETMSGGK